METEAIFLPGKKYDISENPKGVELKVIQQREKEMHGRFVTVSLRPPTQIFVRDGENEKERINAYLEKMKNRPNKWN